MIFSCPSVKPYADTSEMRIVADFLPDTHPAVDSEFGGPSSREKRIGAILDQQLADDLDGRVLMPAF